MIISITYQGTKKAVLQARPFPLTYDECVNANPKSDFNGGNIRIIEL